MSATGARILAPLLAAIMAVAGLGAGPATAQAPQPTLEGVLGSLALPPDDTLPAHAAATVDDTVSELPAVIDAGAIVARGFDAADRMADADWDIAALADSLDYDPVRAFAFVRDRIGFDPYPGILRGAEGTLDARAGNAWDRALLLGALLERMEVPMRFATADLDDAAAAAVLARAFTSPVDPLPAGEVLSLVPVHPSALAARAGRDYARLRDALGDRIATMGPDGPTPTLDAIRPHAWVQAFIGTGWRDLDPTLADAVEGTALTTADATWDEPPAEARHTVTLRMDATTLAPGATATDQRTVLDATFDAADAAARPIYLYFQPELDGIGGTITEVLSGDRGWTPVLLVDGVATAGEAFPAGGRGTDVFGDATDAPELVSLVLTIATDGPGLVRSETTRTLVDRLPPDVTPGSETLSVDAATLPPLAIANDLPVFTGGLHQVLISTGATDLQETAVGLGAAAWFAQNRLADPEAAAEYALGDQLWPLDVSNRLTVVANERLIVPGLTGDPVLRAVIGRPRAWLFSVGPDPVDGTGISTTVDLALDDIAIADAGEASTPAPGARIAAARLWYGALETALETQVALARAAAVTPEGRRVWSLSLAMDAPLEVVPAGATAPAGAGRALLASRRAGETAVIPTGERAPAAFWAIDPATGRTRSVSEPGVRQGFTWGGNHVNASLGGPRLVVDPATGRELGFIKNGTFYRYGNPPSGTCRGGDSTGYIAILGCVSIPASWGFAVIVGALTVAVVSWAYALFSLVDLLSG